MPKKENRPSVANLKNKIEEKNIKVKNKEPVLGNLDKLESKLNLNKKDNTNSEKSENVEEAEDEDESELEEDVDDSNLNLQSLEFHQFMELDDSADSRAPVLERMALSAPRPIFVGGIPRDAPTADTGESGGEFKYVSGGGNANEPKYFSEHEINAPERIDLAQAGRERAGSFREEINQERFFMQSEPRIDSQNQERFERPGRFDIERERRMDSSERMEAERQKYKPKLPRS